MLQVAVLNSLRFTHCYPQTPWEWKRCCRGHAQTLEALEMGLSEGKLETTNVGCYWPPCIFRKRLLCLNHLNRSISASCLSSWTDCKTSVECIFIKRKTYREKRILFAFRPLYWQLFLSVPLACRDEHTLVFGVQGGRDISSLCYNCCVMIFTSESNIIVIWGFPLSLLSIIVVSSLACSLFCPTAIMHELILWYPGLSEEG